MNQSMTASRGYKCPVRGCNKKNRLYTLKGILIHIRDKHGTKEVEKRLKIKIEKRLKIKIYERE